MKMDNLCSNCDQRILSPQTFSERSRLEINPLYEMIGCIPKDDSNLGSTELCTECSSLLKLFCKGKEKFLQRMHHGSSMNRMIQSKRKTENDLQKNMAKETNCDLRDKSNFAMENSPIGDSETQYASYYKEFPELNIKLELPKLQIECLVHSMPSTSMANTTTIAQFCQKCGRQFTSLEELENHVSSAHGKTSYSCHFCGKQFTHDWFYKNHIKSVHDGIEITFTCGECNQHYDNQTELENHQLSAHCIASLPFKCNYCDIAYETVDEIQLLREHLIGYHSDSKEAAAAKFNTEMIKIMNNGFKSEKCKFRTCGICGILFDTQDAFIVHTLFHHLEYKACHTCDLMFSSEAEFFQHHSRESNNENHKSVQSSNQLAGHLDYAAVSPFACEVCGSKFQGVLQLREHYPSHINRRIQI